MLGDLDHELRDRPASVGRMAEARADSDDPADDLVFEAWLHKAAMEAVIGHYEPIAERMSALADEIAEEFVALDRDASLQVAGDVAPSDLIGSASTCKRDAGDQGRHHPPRSSRRRRATAAGWC